MKIRELVLETVDLEKEERRVDEIVLEPVKEGSEKLEK